MPEVVSLKVYSSLLKRACCYSRFPGAWVVILPQRLAKAYIPTMDTSVTVGSSGS